MSSLAKWNTLLVVAFVVTLAGLRYINRDKPPVAFESKATVPYGSYHTFPFSVSASVGLVINVKSDSRYKYNAFTLSWGEHGASPWCGFPRER